MKKTFGIVITLLVVASVSLTCAFAAEYVKYSKNFIKNFKDCDEYSETTESEFEAKNFSTSRKIIGWRNGQCKYQETIKAQDGNYVINCSFPSIQVDELYDAMRDKSKEMERYELEIFGKYKDPKTGATRYTPTGTQTIKGNKAYITWTKYLNNPYFCSPQKI